MKDSGHWILDERSSTEQSVKQIEETCCKYEKAIIKSKKTIRYIKLVQKTHISTIILI